MTLVLVKQKQQLNIAILWLIYLLMTFILKIEYPSLSIKLPSLAQFFIYKSTLLMDDYDFNKDTLKPTKTYRSPNEPKTFNKSKATTQRSKSKEKIIVTSFSKKQLEHLKTGRSPQTNTQTSRAAKLASVESPKKSPCLSEYYIKTAETKNDLDPVQLHEEIKAKDAQIQLLTVRLAKTEHMLSQLKNDNQLKQNRIDTLEQERNTLLTQNLQNLDERHYGVDLAYQVDKSKQDQKRLIKMLQKTAEYEHFAKFAILDDGISFLNEPNLTKKSSLDALTSNKPLHYCSCNKEYISESTFWVPEHFYNFGKDFIKQRKGQFTKSQYELLLYELNRMWRQREKKIVNTLNGQKARQIQKYKRRQASFRSLRKSSVSK